MVGENFKIYAYEMDRNTFNLSSMVGNCFEMSTSKMARNGFNLSTMVGEIFEICTSEMARNALHLVEIHVSTFDAGLIHTSRYRRVEIKYSSRKKLSVN